MASTTTFAFFSSAFGFVAAAISLLAFFINICRSHLPSNKIKTLESLLDETETCFKKAVEDGLLIELAFLQRTERRLTILRMRTNGLRSRAYNATTLCKDYIELLNGTSSSIGRTCGSLKKLRAEVVTSSEEGRRRLMDISFTPYCSSPPPTAPFNLNPEPERRLNRLPSIVVPRPRSCPPMLSIWKSDHVLRASTQSNPFRDPTLSDPGVRIADVRNCTSTIHTSVTAEPGA